MDSEDTGTLIFIAICSVFLSGFVGFGAGAMIFDSWLRAFGFSILLAAIVPVLVLLGLSIMKPWNRK